MDVAMAARVALRGGRGAPPPPTPPRPSAAALRVPAASLSSSSALAASAASTASAASVAASAASSAASASAAWRPRLVNCAWGGGAGPRTAAAALAAAVAGASVVGLRRRACRRRKRCFGGKVALKDLSAIRAKTVLGAKKSTANDDSKNQNQQAKFESLLKSLNRKYGEGTVRRMSDTSCHEQVERFSSGILSLDMAMGGGWRKGRILEIFGKEASGKTTIALHAIAEIQKLGGEVLYVDTEQTLNMEYAQRIGVSNTMPLIQPAVGEEAMDIIQDAVESGALSLIVLDSVAALCTQEEVDKEMGQSTIGLVARLMSKAMRKLSPIAAKNNCSIIFINQLRANIGGYGAAEDTTGGKALKYYSSLRLQVTAPASGRLGPAEAPYGITSKVKVVKNKFFPPHRSCEFDIIYGEGVPRPNAVFQAALRENFIDQKGAWFQYGEDARFQGKEKFVAHLKENTDLCNKLEEMCLATLDKQSKTEDEAEEAEEEEEYAEVEEEEEYAEPEVAVGETAVKEQTKAAEAAEPKPKKQPAPGTVAELRARCEALGLPSTGKKAELQQRLAKAKAEA